MAEPDFTLAEGDTAPVLRLQLLEPVDPKDPDYATYPLGRPLDLTGATIRVRLRIDDDSQPAIEKGALIDGDPRQGWMIFEWDGYGPGRYLGRIKVTQNNGKKSSYLNDRKFALQVDAAPWSVDGVIVDAPDTAPDPVGTWGTVDTVAALTTLPLLGLVPGQAFFRVRGDNKRYALDGYSGAPADGRVVVDSEDPSLQFFLF